VSAGRRVPSSRDPRVAHALLLFTGKLQQAETLNPECLQVVDAAGGGVGGVSIAVDGASVATTDATGAYRLHALASGTYAVAAAAPHMQFPLLRVVVRPLRSLGGAKSSLGDAKSSRGDAKRSLSDTKSSLGDV
jgi:hypothetical protein